MTYRFPNILPVLVIRNTVVFPSFALPLRVGRMKSVTAVEAAQRNNGYLLALSQFGEGSDQEPEIKNLYRVGTLVKVERVRGNTKDGFQVLVRGLERFRVDHLFEKEGMIQATGNVWPETLDVDFKTSAALVEGIKKLGHEILELLPAETEQVDQLLEGISDLVLLTHLCAGNLELDVASKQDLLESASVKNRALKLLEHMQAQKEALEVQNQINDKLTQKMGKMQREAVLREQLKTIQEELGESGEEAPSGDYRKRIDESQMPPEVRKIAFHELKRLETAGGQSPESHVIRNYLDLLCSMPWKKSSKDTIDLEQARQILDADHYGLEKIKKHIVQHLAVLKLKSNSKGSILLLVGPPGVGKTSLGQSIARALGRKFVRTSLGGVRDDAEIRGHRRTYIGAMPGRVIQSIKRAGENNPVMMLDEIDKLSHSYHGDPASALLEVLDPEQNANFLDHYLDVPFDLSQVFFVATANTLETIPAPLLDRMEVIELTGYTTAEKLRIARAHLVPKQLEIHGLTSEQLEISDAALLNVIHSYTREAGVRELQRRLGSLCRAATEKVLEGKAELPIRILPENLDEILGPERFVHEVAERIATPGVVTGLAWTPQGGDILFVEASLMKGSGKLILTGQLGDVMKESAHIALSLVRSRLASIVPGFEFEKNDIHIHVPSGAIPKDGPSAGVSMVTALASLFTGKSLHPKTAMTGEITLRGMVMPVGGIKEKVLAAHRAGIERVILPKRNQKDLRDVPEEVRSQLKFELVENVNEVMRLALGVDVTQPLSGRDLPSTPAPAVA